MMQSSVTRPKFGRVGLSDTESVMGDSTILPPNDELPEPLPETSWGKLSLYERMLKLWESWRSGSDEPTRKGRISQGVNQWKQTS